MRFTGEEIEKIRSIFHLFCSRQCAICLIPYDAVIKLEAEDEEAQVLYQSGLNQYVSSHELAKWIHHTNGGPSPKHRFDFFKNISCSVIVRLSQHFSMDLEMFEYETNEFMDICKVGTEKV